jgi:hypothetical protein
MQRAGRSSRLSLDWSGQALDVNGRVRPLFAAYVDGLCRLNDRAWSAEERALPMRRHSLAALVVLCALHRALVRVLALPPTKILLLADERLTTFHASHRELDPLERTKFSRWWTSLSDTATSISESRCAFASARG